MRQSVEAVSALVWRCSEIGRDQVAHGVHARYRIIQVQAGWRLTGVEHGTGWALLDLPPEGRLFGSLHAAQVAAAKLDRAPAGEMSGA